MPDEPRQILLVSGSLRQASTNTALLRTAAAAPSGVSARLYDGMRSLPLFDPDDDRPPLHPAVSGLRRAVRAAHAVVWSTPEYAGALPGSLKNLLDWTVGDDQPQSIYHKPVAWINASASPTGAADAHESLAKVLGYVHARVIADACVRVPVTRQMVGGDGLIADADVRAELARVLRVLEAIR